MIHVVWQEREIVRFAENPEEEVANKEKEIEDSDKQIRELRTTECVPVHVSDRAII